MTVALHYHGVTEEAISAVDTEEDVAGMEEAGSGVDLDLSVLVNYFFSINQFLPLALFVLVYPTLNPTFSVFKV